MADQHKELKNEQIPLKQTSITDMPLGGENPNPGFLTDKGAPYVTEGNQQVSSEREKNTDTHEASTS